MVFLPSSLVPSSPGFPFLYVVHTISQHARRSLPPLTIFPILPGGRGLRLEHAEKEPVRAIRGRDYPARFGSRRSPRRGSRRTSPYPPPSVLALIHRSAWKWNSANLAF